MTLFDTEREYNLKSKMFLDETGTVNIARYDKIKYQKLDDLYEKQLGFFWRPQEVDITRDAKDFKQLPEHEQHIFTSNLKRQILLDSINTRSPAMLLPIISIPELESWVVLWCLNEQIHSKSYTHIIRNVYPDPSLVFDEMLNMKEIVECADDIKYYYEDLYNKILIYQTEYNQYSKSEQKKFLYELKKSLWKGLHCINALEGVRFYVSFACSWNFAEQKKMEGNAKIIKLIARDENCVTPDTEVLTENGWKYISKLKENEKIAEYREDKSIEFVKPNKIIKKYYEGDLYHFRNKKMTFSSCVTGDHRVIWRDKKGNIREDLAKDIKLSNQKYFITGTIDDGKWNEKLIPCGSTKNNKYKSNYKGNVYCVNVDSGMFITRHRNCVMVTGNCHLAVTQHLLKWLPDDDEDFIKIKEECKDECTKMWTDVVEQEKLWADYLFQYGSMIGLNANILKDYVEFIARKRMKSVDLPEIYTVKTNPLPWTQKWIGGKEVQVAPQEVELSSYVIGSIKQDIDDETFDDIKL